MRKLISIIVLLVFAFGIIGCGNKSSKEYIKEGKEQLQNKQYEKALESFNSAIDEDSKNEEAIVLSEIIQGYLKGKKCLKEEDLDNAKQTLENINKEYEKYAIKQDIDLLKNEIDKQLSQNQEINDKQQAKVENKDKKVNSEPEKSTQPTNKDKNVETTEKNDKDKNTSNQCNKNAKATKKKSFTEDEAIQIAKHKYDSNPDMKYIPTQQGVEDGKKYYEIVVKSISIIKNGGKGTVEVIKVFENGTIKTR